MDLSNLSIFMPGAIGKHVSKIANRESRIEGRKAKAQFRQNSHRAWNVRINRTARQKHESVFYISLVVVCILVFSTFLP